MEQLFDLKLHPQFARTSLVYFTYIKTAPNPDGSKDYWVTTALGRGRFTGTAFTEVEDVFVAAAWSSNIGGASSRLHFLPDGTLLFGVSHRIDEEAPQKLDNHIGKILRLKDDGTRFSPQPWVEGTELPELFWVPSITVAGLTFYSGDKFPKWKHNLFITSMIVGRIPGTGHIVRVVFNENGEVRREELFKNLKQRFRYIQQGPDQLLYALTDHSDGVLLRIEPATAAEFEAATAAGVANRYAMTDANIALLAGKIIEGGEGVWGETPMAPHPAIARDTAEQMVRAILGLATQ